MRTLYLLLALSIFAAPCAAQSTALKRQLKAKVTAAKDDPDKLMDAVRFAQEKKMDRQIEPILKRILKVDPDHTGANEALGRVKHEGVWMHAAKAEKLVSASLKEKYKAQGMAEVDGVWVTKEHVKDAKAGIFHHEGGIVNRWEKRQFLEGRVRHPITGRFIAAADFEKAEQGQFPIADGKWGDKEAANKFHGSWHSPWVVRTRYCNIVTTLPIDTITAKIVGEVDTSYTRVLPVFGGKAPPPNHRPIVRVVGSGDEYTELGAQQGGEGSAHGAFLTHRGSMKLDGTEGQVGVAMWDKSWGPYYTRHAAGLAICSAFCGDARDDVPEWFHRAIGGYVERHFNAHDAKFFGKQHESKGGVKDFAKWLADFKISGDLPERGFGDIGYNVYQAGLVLSFCMRGGDAKTTEALMKATAAFAAGKKPTRAIRSLGRLLAKKEKEIQAYFAETIR